MTRPLRDLIDVDEPAWPLVEGWLRSAHNDVEVLPVERAVGERALAAIQVTTRSPMGAIALESGGILVDHGWLRLLGAGHERMTLGLLEWNGLGATTGPDPELRDALVVAQDAVGGFFAINGGAFAHGDLGRLFYFAPDSLRWEDLGIGYAGFVQWALDGDLAAFYEASRWSTWKDDVAEASGDQGYSIYPFLCTAGAPIEERSRRLVPMTELWAVHWQLAQQAGGLPDGATFNVNVRD